MLSDEITVMVVDDQDLIRSGTAMILGQVEGLRVVAEAADGQTAIDRAARLRPRIALMDIRMPGLDGIETTRRLIRESPETKVIGLTTFDLDEYAFGCLEAGGSGFLLKDASTAQLVESIRNVAAGDVALSPRIVRRLLELHRNVAPLRASTQHPIELRTFTERETAVLDLIARGLSNAEIATELFLSESTVKTHVGKVLMKLGVRDRVHAVIFAYENGMIR